MERLSGSRVRYFDYDKNREINGVVEEINGSMAYVREDNGNADWRDRRELRRS